MRARITASGVALAALITLLAGCTFVTPQASTVQYEPSDGVSATIGDVRVANALLVVGDEDSDADGPNLVFTAVNAGDDEVTLNVQVDVDGEKVDTTLDLEPGSTRVGSGENGQFVLPGVEATPGSLVKVYFQHGDEPGHELQVPVFGGTWSDYVELIPTATPTPEPSETPAAEETPAVEG